jgi:hypothetical protein
VRARATGTNYPPTVSSQSSYAVHLGSHPIDPFTVRDEAVLPVLPLWPGFAINTLFYAVIVWLLFAAPFALRRRIRIRRGLCPACAYPIGDSEVCTECGKTVNARAKGMEMRP